MTVVYPTSDYYWEHQAIATHAIDPPIQNTWYTILDTQEDCRLYWVAVIHDNDDPAAKDMEARITIDGATSTASAFSANDETLYYIQWQTYQDVLEATTSHVSPLRNRQALDGQSIKVEYRMTGAPGTNEGIDGYAMYALQKVT